MDEMGRIFIKTFGKMLLPRGFFIWNNCFYRIDKAAGLIWIVALDNVDNSSFNINYDIKAFCHGLDMPSFNGGIYQVTGQWAKCSEFISTELLNQDNMYKMDVNAMVFKKLLLEPFTSIQTMEEFQQFRQWHFTDLLGGIPKMEHWLFLEVWEHIYLQDYDKGYDVFRNAFDRWKGRIMKNPAMKNDPQNKEKETLYLGLEKAFAENNKIVLQQAVNQKVEVSYCNIRNYFNSETIV